MNASSPLLDIHRSIQRTAQDAGRRVAAMLQSDLLERTGADALVDSDLSKGSAMITCAIELDTRGSAAPP